MRKVKALLLCHRKQWMAFLSAVFFFIGIMSFFSAALQGAMKVKAIDQDDLSAANWVTSSGNSVTGSGPITLSMQSGNVRNGIGYTKPLDVSKEVEFTFNINDWVYQKNGSFFAITFGKTAGVDTFNNSTSGVYTNGITYLFYRKNNASTYVFENASGDGITPTTGWRAWAKSDQDIKVRLKAEEEGWALYMARQGTDTYERESLVSYDKAPKDIFEDNTAYLSLYVHEVATLDNPIQLTVKSISGVKQAAGNPTTGDIKAENWTSSDGSTVTGAGPVAINLNGKFGLGVGYNKPLDVTEQVNFTFTFDDWAIVQACNFAITFSKTAGANQFENPANGYANGITYLFDRKNNGNLFTFTRQAGQVKDGSTAGAANSWRGWGKAGQEIKVRLKAEEDGWALYMAKAGTDNYEKECLVTYDKAPKDFFTDNTAYLSLYAYEASADKVPIRLTVKSISWIEYNGGSTGEEMRFDSFNQAVYTQPYWNGDTVYHEALLPLSEADGSVPDFQLMYPIEKILFVRSSDLKTVYQQGKDYEVVNGKLRILPGGSIPVMSHAAYYPTESGEKTHGKTGGGYIFYSEGADLHNAQLAVSYEHADSWDGPVPLSKKALLPETMSKLTGGQALKVVFYGDSITTGANSSGKLHAAPNADTWMDMVLNGLKSVYGNDNIISANTAVGGKGIQWGLDEVQQRVVDQNPDLVILGFGMNDVMDAEDFAKRVEAIIAAVRSSNPKVEFVLVSSMLPNPESVMVSTSDRGKYEPALLALESRGIAVADVTEVHRYMMTLKKYGDMTGNNINHPNDFIARLYAQVVLTTLGQGEAGDKLLYTDKTIELSADQNYWSGSELTEWKQNTLTINGSQQTQNSAAYYHGSRLYEKMAQFDLEYSLNQGDWIMMLLRAGNPSVAPWEQESAYALQMTGNSISLMKYVNRSATELTKCYFAGDVSGSNHTFRIGTIDVGDGVMIVADMDGKNIVSYLDVSKPLSAPGYLMVYTYQTAKAVLTLTGSEADDDSNLQEKPGDEFSYVGNGFDHALNHLIDHKRLIDDKGLAGLAPESIPEPDGNEKNPLVLYLEELEDILPYANKNEVLYIDISAKPIVDASLFEELMKPQYDGLTVAFEYYDETDELAYRLTLKADDIKKAMTTDLRLTGFPGTLKNGYAFKENYEPYVLRFPTAELPGEMELLYRLPSGWCNENGSENLYVLRGNADQTSYVVSQKGMNLDRWLRITLEVSNGGDYLISDRLLTAAAEVSPGTGVVLNGWSLAAFLAAILLLIGAVFTKNNRYAAESV